jgi:hypothetical protein
MTNKMNEENKMGKVNKMGYTVVPSWLFVSEKSFTFKPNIEEIYVYPNIGEAWKDCEQDKKMILAQVIYSDCKAGMANYGGDIVAVKHIVTFSVLAYVNDCGWKTSERNASVFEAVHSLLRDMDHDDPVGSFSFNISMSVMLEESDDGLQRTFRKYTTTVQQSTRGWEFDTPWNSDTTEVEDDDDEE